MQKSTSLPASAKRDPATSSSSSISPENLALLYDQDEEPMDLVVLWGKSITTPRWDEPFQQQTSKFVTSAEYFSHTVAGSEQYEQFYPDTKGHFTFIKPKKFCVNFQNAPVHPISFPSYPRLPPAPPPLPPTTHTTNVLEFTRP